MSWIIAAFIIGIAGYLAMQRSNFLIDYALIVYVFNRGLRRVLDWSNGEFDRLSPISLTPLLVACMMFLPFIQRYPLLPRTHRLIFNCLFIATGYAFVVGFVRIQFGAVFALAEALAPISMLGYIVTAGAPTSIKDRWIRTAAWCAIVASAYGWYQYLTIPPWDAFWVTSVGFVGYLGELIPTKMTVFSTMSERGVLVSYLAFAIVPMIVSSKWRTVLGWVGVVLVFSVIFLTLSRGGIIIATLSVAVFVVINRGANLRSVILGAVILTLAVVFGLKQLPGGERISERFVTLGDMQNDGSYQGRSELRRSGLMQTLANPLGFGLGAAGLAGRVNSNSLDAQAVSSDAGYFDIFATYGWLGSGLFFFAVWKIWDEINRRYRVGYRSGQVLLARTFLIVLIPVTFAGNFLSSLSILWVVFGSALCPEGYNQFRRLLAKKRKQSKASPPLTHLPS